MGRRFVRFSGFLTNVDTPRSDGPDLATNAANVLLIYVKWTPVDGAPEGDGGVNVYSDIYVGVLEGVESSGEVGGGGDVGNVGDVEDKGLAEVAAVLVVQGKGLMEVAAEVYAYELVKEDKTYVQ